jgi:hypothetical protein
MADPATDSKPAPAKVAVIQPLVRIGLAEHDRNIWTARAPIGVKPDDVAKPDYWTNVARNFRVGDRIEVTAEDFTFFIELLVIDAGMLHANVAVLRTVALAISTKKRTPGYTIAFGGVGTRFRVVRDKDGVVLKDQLPTMADAQSWLAAHVNSLAA